jgi:hypothetical protein
MANTPPDALTLAQDFIDNAGLVTVDSVDSKATGDAQMATFLAYWYASTGFTRRTFRITVTEIPDESNEDGCQLA